MPLIASLEKIEWWRRVGGSEGERESTVARIWNQVLLECSSRYNYSLPIHSTPGMNLTVCHLIGMSGALLTIQKQRTKILASHSHKNRETSTMTEADAAAGGGGSAATSKQPQSKRQRRKHVNPSNTWPQQPKIQTAEARAKANLRVAGLSNTTTTTPNAPVLDPKLDLHSPEVRFCRFLGAPEQRKRHLAVTNLQQYLKKRSDIESTTGISEMDLLKLWKGLWFTLYLADKVPVQEELAKRLAKLIWCVAGTEEEDEYAAQMYLDYLTQQDEDVIMENVVDTVENGDGDDDEEEEYNEENGVNSDEEEKEEDSAGNDEHVEGEQRLQEQEEEDEIPDELVQHCRGAHLAALFVKTFFRTIQREWGKMDKHRIDKFYTLVRLVLREVRESIGYMASS